MSPTGPDRDTKSPTSKDQDENPFIKFKQFADAQIGAVLQGIVGLPSVLSKQNGNADSRWADSHDDLKLRDKRLSELRASQASESSSGNLDREDEEVGLLAKKFSGLSPPTSTQADALSVFRLSNRDGKQQSIDLFSPVTKSLFAHLVRSTADDVDWSKPKLLAQEQERFFEYPTLWLQHDLRNDQKSGNALDMIQSMTYNSLDRGSTQLLSSQSVLPYILFSPYSPLALSSSPQPSRSDSLFEDFNDDFPYCAAFEDLLLMSQGRPMATLVPWPVHLRDMMTHLQDTTNVLISKDSQDRELAKATTGLDWIERLWDYGLLTKEPPPGYSSIRYLDGHPSRMIFAKPVVEVRKLVEPKSKEEGGPGTEQDIYSFLERIGGSTRPPLPFRDAMQAMEVFLKDAVAELEKNNTGNRSSSSRRAHSTLAEADASPKDSSMMSRLGFNIGKTASTQTEEVTAHDIEPVNATRSAESDQQADQDRVVATTTTTQQTTDENGSVHTTVMIKRIYADGRTSVTTTTKANYPPKDRRFADGEAEDLPVDEERRDHADDDFEAKEEPRHKQENSGRKKGWFWN